MLEAARNAYDAIVIDTGPLFDAAVLAALDHTDQLLLVCNPEVTSLKNVRIGLETIDRLGFDRERVSLVVNKLGAAGGVSRDDIELALDAKIAFELPDDPAVPAAVNRALPVSSPRAAASSRARSRAGRRGLPGARKRQRSRLPSGASSCGVVDERHRPQRPRARDRRVAFSPSVSRSTGAPCAHERGTRTPS